MPQIIGKILQTILAIFNAFDRFIKYYMPSSDHSSQELDRLTIAFLKK